MSSRTALSQMALPGPPVASGEAATKNYVDTTALLVAARGAANGVASLDAATKVPIAQLPTGTTAGTVAAGNDARFADITTLQSLVDPTPTDTMMYGDGLSSMPRRAGTNMATLDNGYYTMSVVIAPKSFTANKIRFYVAQAGVTGGTPAVALRVYGGPTAPYNVVASPALAASDLTSVGLKELALGVALNVVAGNRYIFVSYIPTGAFTTSPGAAFSAIYYSGLNNPAAGPVYNGYKTAAAAPPATISPSDGTWTGNPSTLWWALAA